MHAKGLPFTAMFRRINLVNGAAHTTNSQLNIFTRTVKWLHTESVVLIYDHKILRGGGQKIDNVNYEK